MNPITPKGGPLAANWRPVVYAENQPAYLPLPTLQEVTDHASPTLHDLALAARHVIADKASTVEQQLCARWVLLDVGQRTGAQRVVSVWEPDEKERELLWTMISQARPIRISVMCHVFGQPLQPLRVVVGDFPEPYDEGKREVPRDNAIPWRREQQPGEDPEAQKRTSEASIRRPAGW